MSHSFTSFAGALVMLAATASSALAQEATFKSQTQAEVVPGQYIVKTVPGFRSAAMTAQALGSDFKVIDDLPLLGAQVIEMPRAQDPSALRARARNIPGVSYIEPVYVVRVNVSPNDPRYSEQWGFPKIKAPAAWDQRTDSGNKVVAVIDTGVDYNHPDLSANMWKNPGEIAGNGVDDDGNGVVDDVFGANFVPAAATGDPMDDNRHGTHVAGTIGAVTNNSLGVSGTNWSTQIMAVKFLSASGSGSTAGAIRAIEYAIAMKADIMNNSWGGGGFSQALEDAIKTANDKGILFVAASGNSDSNNDIDPHYPSSYDVANVLAVMATDQADGKAGFSSIGATSVDMGAPGVAILSTTPGGNYDSFNGTSMATPHVAGAAALVWAQNPTLTHLELKKRLMDTAEVIPGLAGTSLTGARLDLAAAMRSGSPPPPAPPPPGPGPNPMVCKSEQHTQIAYNEFFWSEAKTVGENANLLSVTFTLAERMAIDITAHSSARKLDGAGNTVVRSGVFNQPAPNVMWTGSYRRANFASAADHRNVSSNFSIVLPKGSHTIYWKIWVSNASLQFDSGTLTVRGIPCIMGGKLIAAQTLQSADVTEASATE